MSQSASSYTKEELEKQKLMAEIDNLKKSWIKNPASWVSIVTIVVALFGLGFQYQSHKTEQAEAMKNLDNAKDDLKKSTDRLRKVEDALNQKEPQLKQVDAELDKATNELKQLSADREEAQAQLAALNAQLQELQAKANSLPKTPDNQQIQASVRSATVAIVDLQNKNKTIVDKSQLLTDSLARAKARSSVASK